MNAHAMQRHVPAGDADLAMEQPALFEAVRRDVLVVPSLYGKAREDGVAVVAVVVDGVAAVSEIAPHRVGEELVLGLDRPVVAVARGLAVAVTLYFLEKNDVGAQHAQAVAQLVDHQAPVEKREPFVDVVRDDVQAAIHDGCRSGARRPSARAPGNVRRPPACGRARRARARPRGRAP